MSSPLDREFGPDELSPYAPKWAGAAGAATRRATALKQEAGFRVDEAERSTSRFDGGPTIDNYPVPRSLEPNLIPQAYAVRSARSGALLLFVLASAIAAIGTLFVLGTFPAPWAVYAKGQHQDPVSFESRFSEWNSAKAKEPEPPTPQLTLRQEGPRTSGEALPLGASITGPAEGASIVIDGLADGFKITVGESSGMNRWRIPVSEMHGALVHPPSGYVGPVDVILELRLPDDTPVDRKPLCFEWTAAAPPQANEGALSPDDLKQKFEQFVTNYITSTGQTTFSPREKEILFAGFQQFVDGQSRGQNISDALEGEQPAR